MKLIKTGFELADLRDDTEIIYLGNWCYASADNASLLAPSNRALPYHWDDREKYYQDYFVLSRIYEKVLSSLVSVLNGIHGIDRDIRYWRIVIGPWLRFFIDALFDRYECIRMANEGDEDLRYQLYSYDLNDWCPKDFLDFWGHLTSEEWNEIIFSECIKFQNIPYSKVEKRVFPAEKENIESSSPVALFKYGLRWLSSQYSEIIGPGYTGTVLLGAYVPFKKLIKLYFSLSQAPFFALPSFKYKASETNQALRESVRINLNSSGFESLINVLVPIFMPKIYVEDFSELRAKLQRKCPRKPKSIFTANLYQADDIFKIWAAEKSAEGVSLVLGQHGGTFSIARHNQTVDHQFQISDCFISWGWDKCVEDSVIKLPSMQLCGRKQIVPCNDGSILLIQTSLPRYFYCHYAVPVAGQFLSYLQDQLTFIDRLEPAILNNLNIRLDPTLPSRGWDVPGLFGEAGYADKVDKSGQTLVQAIKTSRVCVCTSNSTVFLETLSLNFPTIVFWDSDVNEISLDAQPYINALVNAEILFFNPAQAANHINKLADNVNDWWSSTEVQLAREVFCERYALTSVDWVAEWSNFLKK
jgi:putative transferase (TIGR04331 family)